MNEKREEQNAAAKLADVVRCHKGPDCNCTRSTPSDSPTDPLVISIDQDGRATVDGVVMDTWPDGVEFIVHVGRRCAHVTISSHASRPMKRGVLELTAGTDSATI